MSEIDNPKSTNGGLPLEDALLTFGDPDIVEYVSLRAAGYGVLRYCWPMTQDVPESRCRLLRWQLEQEFVGQLTRGDLVGSGFDGGGRITDPRVQVPRERWPSLKLDYETSSVTDGGLSLRGVVVVIPSGQVAATKPPKLVIRQQAKAIHFDGTEATLTPKAFELFMVLLKGSVDGARPVASSEISFQVRSPHAPGEDARKLIAELRKQLKGKVPALAQLIQNKSRIGYVIALSSDEIRIEA